MLYRLLLVVAGVVLLSLSALSTAHAGEPRPPEAPIGSLASDRDPRIWATFVQCGVPLKL